MGLRLSAIEAINSFLDRTINCSLVPSIRPSVLPRIEADLVIDVGVADGTEFLLEQFPQGEFWFVEANPRYHEHIRTELCPKFRGTLFPVAVGSRRDVLHLIDDGLASGFIERSSKQRNKTVSVQVVPLDELLLDRHIPQRVLLKIDTEGFELEVLRGARQLLKRVSYLVLEMRLKDVKTYNPSELIAFLYEQGFQWGELLKVAHRRGGPNYLDVLFTRFDVGTG